MTFNIIMRTQKYLFSLLTILLALGFMLTEVFNVKILHQTLSVVILFFILLSIPYLRGLISIIIVSMIVLSFVFLFGNEQAFAIVLEGVRTNLTLAAIFIITPLLGIVVKTGDYVEALKQLLIKAKNNVIFFYLATILMTHTLGFILNIGAVTINYYLSSASEVRSKRLIANVLNRGFATAIFWSPYFSAMALMLRQLQIKWQTIALVLFGFVILSFVVSFLLELPYILKEQKDLKASSKNETITFNNSIAKKIVLELCFVLIFLIISVLTLDKFIPFGIVFSICVISILFPIIWCLLKFRWNEYKKEIFDHFFHTLPNMRQEITLFLTAGLFGVAFTQTSLNSQLITFLNNYFGSSTFMLSLIISSIIIITSIIGLHPIILINIFVVSIDPIQIGMTKESFAIVLLISWGLSNTVSPSTVISNILSNTLKEKVINVSLKWNWQFVLVMVILLPFYLYFIRI